MACATCNRQSTNLGIFEGIRLTLVCTVCAAASVSDAGEPIVCFSSSRTLFPGIPPKRVKALESTPRRNPHYKNAAPMRMYSVAELRVVQEILDQESRIKTAHIEQKRQLRLGRMVRVYNISPAAPIHRSLFFPIFGDYLRAPNPKKKLGELKYRYGVHDLSVRLCALDPVAAMNFLERRGVTTTVTYDQLRREFEYSLFVSSRAFRLEGLAISRYICPSQLNKMRDGPLSQIPESADRLRKNAPKMLRMTLQGMGFDGADIHHMLNKCPAMKTRVRRCIEYAHDPETVGAKMAEFWRTRNDRAHRRQVLLSAMESKGLEIREDSVYCHDFIFGLIDVDLEEIVGIQYITRELFDFGGPRYWSDHHHACEFDFRQALLENGNAMDQSIRIALRGMRCKRRRF